MPQYAEYNTIHLSKSQFFHICKGRRPRFIIESGSDVVRIAKTKDGKYWAEWRGAAVFWASAWYEIPRLWGERAEKVQQFVESL
jgi:hypothetical protein